MTDDEAKAVALEFLLALGVPPAQAEREASEDAPSLAKRFETGDELRRYYEAAARFIATDHGGVIDELLKHSTPEEREAYLRRVLAQRKGDVGES